MIFNSIEFALFLPIVFAVYWLLRKRLWWQNLFVVVASYVFYGWWNYRFLLLIFFTTVCSFASGLFMARARGQGGRRWLLVLNLLINLGLLGLFKYYNFFATELAQLLNLSGDAFMLNLALPVGISFYTFQAIGYSIDCYRGTIAPTRNLVAFMAYIGFFPQLVAGPIERAQRLLPQFCKPRQFDYAQAIDGCRQMLWGLFKKMVVADNCASLVNEVFAIGGSPASHLVAMLLFTVQIYGDFSGYSDIAVGCAKLFGIRLMQNFRTPYFSRDVAEFWRRWHISLTTWFRDYLYIPLGGSRVTKWKVVRNTFVIFIVSGLWHGANWTYIAWGLYHACLFMPLILLGRNRRYTGDVAAGRLLPTWRELGQMLCTFLLVSIGWVLFRASGMPSALHFLQDMLHPSAIAGLWQFFTLPEYDVVRIAVPLMFVAEWFTRNNEHPLYGTERWIKPRVVRCVLAGALLVAIIFFRGRYAQFIYFQF